MTAKILPFEDPKMKRNLSYRFIRFWLFIKFKREGVGKPVGKSLAEDLRRVARHVTDRACERGLL